MCSPLAVNLAAFTANAAVDGVTLSWETVSEQDNTGFDVYRTGSVGDWAPSPWDRPEPGDLLAFVPSANPGSTAGASYTYVDTDVVAGQTYWYGWRTWTRPAAAGRDAAATGRRGLGATPAAGVRPVTCLLIAVEMNSPMHQP